jgi:hypothetical protein
MYKLIVLIIIALILFWKFVLSPSKLDFSNRTKVLHGVSLAVDHKKAVNKYWKEKGSLPDAKGWQEAGMKVTVDLGNSLVQSINVGEDGPGTISVIYTNSRNLDIPATVNGKKMILTPTIQGDKLVWSCKGTIPVDLLPAPCR